MSTATQSISTQSISTQSTSQNTPVKSFRLSNVSVSIFENDVEREGKHHSYSSAKVEKSYKDRSGDWKRSNSFSLDELLRLRLLLDKTIDHLAAATFDGK